MRASVLRPAITFATVSAVIIAALAVYLTFTPSSEVAADIGHYDATNTQTLTSSVPGAARGSTTVLTIPIGYANFSNNVTFEPAGVGYTPNCNKDGPDLGTELDYRDYNNDNIVDAGETPCLVRSTDGVNGVGGTQVSDVKLGIANNACDSPLTVTHDLYVIPTPNNELSPRLSSNIAFPSAEGTADRFRRWRIGGEPLGANGSAQTPGLEEEMKDTQGISTRGDGDSMPMQNYPSYLLDLFDPDFTPVLDGPLHPVVPLAVYGGSTFLNGTTWVPLYYAAFDKGALATAFATASPIAFSRMTAALGYPTQAVLNDPTAVKASPNSITDFCTGLVATNTLLATVGGVTRATNPALSGASFAGTHVTVNYTASLRDADNDGIENAFDTCPLNANTEDPRVTKGTDLFSGVPVGDMLDPACDPTPALATGNQDHDLDGFQNAQDICPLNANPLQTDGELNAGPQGTDTTSMDGGQQGDSLGNECDPVVGACPGIAGSQCQNSVFAYTNGPTLTLGITATQTQFTYTISAGDPILAGDYIIIDAEIMRVTDVNAGTNTLVAVRGQAGTAAAAHLAAALIQETYAIKIIINGKATPVVLSTGVSNGHWHNAMNVMPKCYGGIDADGDGYCQGNATGESAGAQCADAIDNETPLDGVVNDGCVQVGATAETGTQCLNAVDDDPADADARVNDGCPAFHGADLADSGSCTTAVPPNCLIRHGAWTTTAAYSFLLSAYDTDRGGGDTTAPGDPGGGNPFGLCGIVPHVNDVCPESGFDTDALETYLGSNPAQSCSADATANNEPYDSWAYDFNDDTRASNPDIIIMGAAFGRDRLRACLQQAVPARRWHVRPGSVTAKHRGERVTALPPGRLQLNRH